MCVRFAIFVTESGLMWKKQTTQLTFTCSKSRIEILKNVWNMFRVNNKNTSWRRSDVLIVNFEHILHLFLMFLFLILSK